MLQVTCFMTTRLLLNKDQVYELVSDNLYSVPENSRYISRDISGRYYNTSGLPALALPGGDLGELAVLYGTARSFGFEINHEKALQVLIELIGGVQNFSLVNEKSFKQDDAYRHFYLNYIKNEPEIFSLDRQDIDYLEKQRSYLMKKGARETIFTNKPHESAVIILKGSCGIYPQYEIKLEGGQVKVQIYIYHQTFINLRRKIFAKELVAKQAVTLFEGCDEEYLYQVLSDTAENHLFETLKKEAAGLPLFQVIVDNDKIKVEEIDNI